MTTATVLVASSFLLVILLMGRRRFTMPFFKMLTVVVSIIVIHSIVSTVFKLFTLWSGLLIPSQNIITLLVDMVSKKLLILLIFLMALNRSAIVLCPKMDKLLFERNRYIVLCTACFAVTAVETYCVIAVSNLRREFIMGIGFVDFIESAKSYEIGCLIFLAIAFISVALHLMIYVYLRCHNRTSSTITTKIQQRLFREVTLMTVVNTMFTLLFIVLYQMPSSFESRIMIISIYNILCFIPDILIPVFILVGSREVHAEISSRLSFTTKMKANKSSKTATLK
ncbi:unnamed protein product [Haemonchus placei]|uniref:Serpentine receptor class gamma n=1 Tax=Haemonchus placei TaxID=6290 RepID=A0A158QK20_HAEPC|nr:unnamed protein product [Haemonchus placei]